MQQQATALIMAGKRSGTLDPLAAAANVSQKSVVPVAGKPMIEHVVAALEACERIGAIRIVAHEADEIRAIPLVARLEREGRLSFRPGAYNLVDSVFAGAEGAAFPLVITTADNCLVTPEGYAEFVEKCLAAGADAAAALARKEDVIAADPEGQKKFYEFTDGGYSNCNTYWIGNEGALSAAEIMRSGGQFVKYPGRIAKAFGLINLARFYFGWGDKDKLFAQISRRFGYKLAPIVLSNGEYAIDVDEPRSHRITEKLLAARTA
ncbi:MAG: NTP transferase domain-containing protein [Alphaproteobacteria bacterium]|nr:NTP transferase domain-containing protein [Alphaproteobacteria bacterium]